MGLSRQSTGTKAAGGPLVIEKRAPGDRVVALAGNPNVGKSTVFNALTGMHQHTGNWPGKTVTNAQGHCRHRGRGYVLVDLPGCYSLLAHSAEEEAARDFLCFGGADCAVAVCDATCLERNLNLVLQMLEITPNLVVCVNLLDEAKRKGIEVDLPGLSRALGVPVVGAAAREGRGLDALMDRVAELCAHPLPPRDAPAVRYSPRAEGLIRAITPTAQRLCGGKCSPRWLAARLAEGPDPSLERALLTHLAPGPEERELLAPLLRGTAGAYADSDTAPLAGRDLPHPPERESPAHSSQLPGAPTGTPADSDTSPRAGRDLPHPPEKESPAHSSQLPGTPTGTPADSDTAPLAGRDLPHPPERETPAHLSQLPGAPTGHDSDKKNKGSNAEQPPGAKGAPYGKVVGLCPTPCQMPVSAAASVGSERSPLGTFPAPGPRNGPARSFIELAPPVPPEGRDLGHSSDVLRIDRQALGDSMAASVVRRAEEIARQVTVSGNGYSPRDRAIDKVLTSPLTGFPIMLLMLLGIFWLTVAGANGPSQLLSRGLFALGDLLRGWTVGLGAPVWLTGLLWDGVYKTLAWVVSVMLPPMAIFFPLFTLLEDLGYLPRVAFNMDRCFQRCGACGKQALTSCMSLGCNAAGVVGCRIIDSPRERLIAMITSNFIPCNGRLPMLISLIAMFFVGASGGLGETVLSAVLLVAVIGMGVAMSFAVSKLLSVTLLKGTPSSFTLELPPYRRPQVGRVIVRSIFDRTLFVLGRAVSVAAPAGLVIWVLANLRVGDASLLSLCAGALDPFARVFGLDGVILLAFILGLPANEIVIPLMIMAYLSQGSLVELSDPAALRALLVGNGWTWVTALCVIIFSVMHWPCSTTCMTIRKESQSWKWTGVAVVMPTVCGLGVCFVVNAVCSLLL